MHSLVIIDMQSQFVATQNGKLIDNIKKEIDISKRNYWPILIVEYKTKWYCTDTIKDIINYIGSYPRTSYVIKKEADGSKEIAGEINQITKCKRIRLVGVETNCCVLQTAAGLSRYNKYKIEVAENSCGDPYGNEFGINVISEIPSVSVIKNTLRPC